MRRVISFITAPAAFTMDVSLLLFRTAVSVQLMMAHGLKKAGIGVYAAEQVPNPLHLPEGFNSGFAMAANLFFQLFIISGLLTRLAVSPVLAVTLTGYFMVHSGGSALARDTPFMYSISFLLLLCTGPGRYSMDHFINKKTRS